MTPSNYIPLGCYLSLKIPRDTWTRIFLFRNYQRNQNTRRYGNR